LTTIAVAIEPRSVSTLVTRSAVLTIRRTATRVRTVAPTRRAAVA
jgi:hypothetical protein